MDEANFEETLKEMNKLVLGSSEISKEQFEQILATHEQFLLNGGAGGRWETFYIKNLIFGVYQHQGKTEQQAMLNFKNLKNMELENIKLPYANCSGVMCKDKSWAGSDLEGCLFVDSVLTNCSFENCDLSAADFSRSDMRNCNFKGAILNHTDFERCDLTGADFRGAKMISTALFKNTILAQTLMDL